MKPRTSVEHFVPCMCKSGGLLVTGIKTEYYEHEHDAYVFVYNVHTQNLDSSYQSFWSRIKNAFRMLRGKTLYLDEATLYKDGVVKLRDACQDMLDRWPDEPRFELPETLQEIYQSLEDERVGRELRLSSQENAK